MNFKKYHALGNDYLVFDPRHQKVKHAFFFDPSFIQRICDRNFGLGSNGILYGPFEHDGEAFGLKILNPDGSEAEKSGNGLRIFTRYLYDNGDVGYKPFKVLTPSGSVECLILDNGERVRVDMGLVSFSSKVIPVIGESREVIEETIKVEGCKYRYCAATIGNPHCVLHMNDVSKELVCKLGPKLEWHENFPNRTNVQLVEILDRGAIRIEIWERGAGYTLASGTSSSAAAAVSYRLGLCDREITVEMPGGNIEIAVGEDYNISMIGGVTSVASIELDEEAL